MALEKRIHLIQKKHSAQETSPVNSYLTSVGQLSPFLVVLGFIVMAKALHRCTNGYGCHPVVLQFSARCDQLPYMIDKNARH